MKSNRMGKKGLGRKLVSFASVVVMVCSSLALPSLLALSNVDVAPDKPQAAERPVSSWDFRWYNSTGGDFAANTPFSNLALDKDLADNQSVSISSGGEEVSLGFVSAAFSGDNQPTRASVSSTAKTNGTAAQFDSAFGAEYEVHLVNALNGVKTLLEVSERPASTGDLLFTLRLDYNSSRLSIFADGAKIDLYASDAKLVELRDEAGKPVFTMPEPLIWDSPDPYLDESTNEWISDWGTVDYLPTSFFVSTANNLTTVSVAVSEKYLSASTTRYPIFVDPSLGPTISTSVEVDDQIVYQESALSIVSGGTLKLVNSSLIFNGNYAFTVYSGAKLELINSTVTVNSTPGQHITMSVSGQMYANFSAIEYTLSGIQVSSSVFFLNHTTVSHSGANGIVFNSGVGQKILNSTVTSNNAIGISGAPSVTGVRIYDSTVGSNGGGGASFLSGTGLELVRTTFQSNGGNALMIAGAAATTLESLGFYNNFVAVALSASTNYLDNSTIDGSTLWDYSITGGTLWSRSTWFSRPKVTTSGPGKLVSQWRLNLTVLDAGGNPVGSQAVTIYNRTGASVANGNTNATGFFSALVTEFNLTASTREFYSPHSISYGTGADDQGIPLDVDGNRSLTLRQGGDTDWDGAPNVNETNPESHWFEAEHWAPKLAWIANDSMAADSKAVKPVGISANDDLLQTSNWDAYPAGDYVAYFRLKSTAGDSNATVTLRVDGAGGQLAARTLSFNDSSFGWFSMGPFSTGGSGNVSLKPRILAGTNAGLVLVDRLMLARVSNGASDINGSYAFSDWLRPDTDGDGAADGIELVKGDHWREGEMMVAAPVDDASAANRQAASHPDSVALVASLRVTDYFVANDYQVWIKARSTHGSSGYNVTVDVDGTAASPANSSGTALERYLWFHTDNFTLASGGTHTVVVYVNDSGDPSTGDADDYLWLDKLFIWKTVDYTGAYVPFMVSDVFDADSDRDNLSDGREELGYFTADRQEVENYTAQNLTSPTENGLTMDGPLDNFTLSWAARERGYYQLRLPVFQAVSLENTFFQSSCTPEDLMWFTNVTVFDGQNQEVPRTSRDQFAHNVSQNATAAQQWVNRSVFTMYRYFLDVGNYSGVFSLNMTAVLSIYSKCGIGHSMAVNLSYDALFIEKQVLNTLDVDYDRDGLWDGHEVTIETFPLNVDSDYDALSDAEEVYPLADGFITNALMNDTDRDGLLDPVEIGLDGWDADNSTTTDPTNEDTDGDHVPDGWIDGWGYSAFFEYWSRSPITDDLKQFWEGEDLNLDGKVNNLDGSAWNSTFQFDTSTKESKTSETDPTSADTDGDSVHDGWEMEIWGYVNGSSQQPMVLNPLNGTDSQRDVDYNLSNWAQEGDGLATYGEYNLNLNPFIGDTDADFIVDGVETSIGLRTNLSGGMHSIKPYDHANGDDWIFFDPNPFNASVIGRNYTFVSATVNATGASEFNASSPGLRNVLRMWDGSEVYWNASSNRLYIWAPMSDPADENKDGVLLGVVYRFDRNDSVVGVGSLNPVLGYRWREAPVQIDPRIRDSDGDGVIDGYDGWNATTTLAWRVDLDGDGIVNAADTDSDGDGVTDGQENGDGDAFFEPASLELNAYNNDTDGDGLNDSADQQPLDHDNDNETGWNGFSNSFGAFPPFGGTEASLGTDPSNPDTDGDGLWDGAEDFDHNGHVNAITETSPTDVDSDDDGLWDGHNITVGGTTYRGELNYSTRPASRDSDLDQVQDGTELGLTNASVYFGATNGTNASIFLPDADPSRVTDPLQPDSDHDGLFDGWIESWPGNGEWDAFELGEDKNRNGRLDWNETDPSLGDTDWDRLNDYQEVVVLHSNATNADTDGDGLRDPYEPFATMDYDGDGAKNVRDGDSDADTTGQYNGTDGAEVSNSAVLKTNATNGSFISGTWVAVMITDGDSALTPFVFEGLLGAADLGQKWPVNFTSDFAAVGGGRQHPQVATAEGRLIWKNATHVFVQLDSQFASYRPWHAGDPSIPSNGTDLAAYDDYASTYRLAYNWSLVLNNDNDHDGLSSTQDPNNTNPDIDNDGLLDGWEVYVYGTNLTNSDTDGDGLLDGWEAANLTDPSKPDTDNDGLWDGANRTVGGVLYLGELDFGTNASTADTDSDQIPDGYEASRGLSPAVATFPIGDHDGDGLNDQEEYLWRMPKEWAPTPVTLVIGVKQVPTIILPYGVWWNGTNASDPDTEHDGISDAWEERWTEILEARGGTPNAFDPLNYTDRGADADSDGLSNYFEYVYRFGGDMNGFTWDYVANGTYWGGTDPTRPDTDSDGLTDVWEANANRTTNATSRDTDGDGLPDLVEVNGWHVNVTVDFIWQFQGHPYFAQNTSRLVYSDPARRFTSGNATNSIPDLDKYALKLDPGTLDTDADGLSDLAEWQHADEPNQYNPTVVERIPPTIANLSAQVSYDFAGCWLEVHFTAQDVVEVPKADVWFHDGQGGAFGGTATVIEDWGTGKLFGVQQHFWDAYDFTTATDFERICFDDRVNWSVYIEAWDFVGNRHGESVNITATPGVMHDLKTALDAATEALVRGATLSGEQLARISASDAVSSFLPLWRAYVQLDAQNSARDAPCTSLEDLAMAYHVSLNSTNPATALQARQSLIDQMFALTHLDAVRASIHELAQFSYDFSLRHPQFGVDFIAQRAGALSLGEAGRALAASAGACFADAPGQLEHLFPETGGLAYPAGLCLSNATKVEVAVIFTTTADHFVALQGYNRSYFEGLTARVQSYYCGVTGGDVLLNFTFFGGDHPLLLPTSKTLEGYYGNPLQPEGSNDYFRDSRIVATAAGYNASHFQLTAHVFPYLDQQTLDTYKDEGVDIGTHHSMYVRFTDNATVGVREVVISALNGMGIWAHELGHGMAQALGDVRGQTYTMWDDLYRSDVACIFAASACGEVGTSSLMGTGDHFGVPADETPTYPSLFNLNDIGEANFIDVTRDGIARDLLALPNLGGTGHSSGIRFWSEPDDPANSTDPWTYFVAEARATNPGDSFWDRGAPHSGVYIYRVSNWLGDESGILYPPFPSVMLLAVLTPDAAFPTDWLMGAIWDPEREGATRLGTFQGLYYESLAFDLSVKINGWHINADNRMVFNISVDRAAVSADALRGWKFNYTAMNETETVDHLALLMFPWGTYVDTFAAALSREMGAVERAAKLRYLNTTWVA